ncbi:MAG: MerR family transcriptional regulator [Ginsengibacter sp.]
MDSFSITQLSRFSGIKPHTIRIWEQRYQALKPARSKGNTRSYSGFDLKRLLNIVSLQDQHKVSELCTMNDKTLNSLVTQLYTRKIEENYQHFVSQLIATGIDFNESSFQKILSHCLLRFGVNKTYGKIIYPLLDRLGLMWASDQLPPAQEHFICNMIRQKLLTAIDSLPSPNDNAKKWLLFLPEDEYHEIGLLFAKYILNLRGEKVFYLGSSVPMNTLSMASKNIAPEALLLFFVHYDFPENIKLYLSLLSKNFRNVPIYVSGNHLLLDNIKLNKQVTWLKSIDDLEKVIH